MGFVALLRFNDNQGAILGDEESWHLRRNKTYVNDPVHALLERDEAERLGVDLAYAGSGTPSFHRMVVERSRSAIAAFLAKNGRKPVTLEKLARLTMTEMNNLHREWRDNRLQFYFGFDADALVRGSFQADGSKVDIAADEVKKKAKKIIEKNDGGGYHNENHALVIGYDGKGINAFCLKSEIGVLSYVSCGFDVLGKGKYGSAGQFKDVLEPLTLKTRRAGFDRGLGLYSLIRGGLGSSEYYNESGGNFHLILLDRTAKGAARRIEIRDHRARLAREMVVAEMAGLLTRDRVCPLLDELLYGGEKTAAIEKRFFAAVGNDTLLQMVLCGYKLDDELRSHAQQIHGKSVKSQPVTPTRRRKGVRS